MEDIFVWIAVLIFCIILNPNAGAWICALLVLFCGFWFIFNEMKNK